MKKHLVLSALALTALNFSSSAHAAPVLTANAAFNQGLFTAYPDDTDPNLYYVRPGSIDLLEAADGTPLISYREVARSQEEREHAILEMTVGFDFTSSTFQSNLKTFLANHPGARYTFLPLENIQAEIFSHFPEVFGVQEAHCMNLNGPTSSAFHCTLKYNKKGMALNRRLFTGNFFILLYATFSFQGVQEDLDGKFTPVTRKFGTSGVAYTSELIAHPELTRDASGNPIEFSKN